MVLPSSTDPASTALVTSTSVGPSSAVNPTNGAVPGGARGLTGGVAVLSGLLGAAFAL
ncbi:hypothetical protein BD310DRAFT_940867 [Dichomitus squalens]|uniref:Uncharacterized protein n=1 Tax=Dichomitus squalens TaxID=114155 RepID=A0A4Q9PGF0_9APHY|nr:hypothetical protein BD310DRAFT_940867 [Dichomitus squalens]